MPSGGTRSTNGSCAGGAARCTAATTLSYCCGPVTANTLGNFSVIFSGSAPMQPVTTTLPFSLSAAPIAPSDSACVLARELVALGAQTRQDALAVDERLRAAERDVRNPRHSPDFLLEHDLVR